MVKVKVLETDDKGRVKLSMKALLDRPAGMPERTERPAPADRQRREYREPRQPRAEQNGAADADQQQQQQQQ